MEDGPNFCGLLRKMLLLNHFQLLDTNKEKGFLEHFFLSQPDKICHTYTKNKDRLKDRLHDYKDFFFQEFVTHEARLFNNLPFTQVTMKDQDKKENFFKALGIGMEDTPYFPHLIFYVCLAIIKKNNFDATKDRKQNQDFIQLMEYIKLHYQDFLKTILSPPYNAQVRSGERPKFDIPYRFGLFRL